VQKVVVYVEVKALLGALSLDWIGRPLGDHPDPRMLDGATPLLVAAKMGHTAVVQYLIEVVSDITPLFFSGMFVLHPQHCAHLQAPTRSAPVEGSSFDAHLEIYFSYQNRPSLVCLLHVLVVCDVRCQVEIRW
jgi:hypothetical protein